MTDNNNTPRTPELRFPGFTGEWVEKKFRNITFHAGEKNKNNLSYERYSISNEFGFHPQNEQFEGGGGYLKNIDCSNHIIVSPHSFAYNPARINVGSIGYQNLDKEVIISPLYEVFQTTEDCDDVFLWQWFQTDVFHKIVMETQEGGVRQCFSYKKLCECSIFLPPTLPEQQKIADFLSAVDEEIAAEEQKANALKDHKKGLLQQLFPSMSNEQLAMSNCVPKRRFPGFSGEWEAPTISDIFEIRNGYTPSKRIPEYWEGGTIPWFRMEDIRENGGILADAIQHISPLGVKGKGLFKKNSIILATTATIGIHAMLIADSLANQRFTNFSIRESLSHLYSPMYIYYAFFGIDEWCKKNTNAGGLLSVNMPALLKQPFPTPTLAEQQKIADCLSSLDEEIAAQQQKVEALKEHKKGLMQKLFPSMSN